ncbi:MAG: U32 family peptidase [Clostridiales bacterium]|nr:U32 family peptidase [Clostridiales bacterium]
MRKTEILAPAGSYEGILADVAAGADAVYVGGTRFSARAYADNLSGEQLCDAIDYVHLHNKKLYLTVNTLLRCEELEEELYDYICPFYEKGLDAVIVQDFGVLSFLHEQFPDLPIHASTQMTITTPASAERLKEYGVTRIVPARELSITEVRNMKKKTGLEIECFTHGALCYCYSGQCLMSSLIGGRSGNRGRCAQPCRKRYQDTGGKSGYFLSPKDMMTLELIPELIEAGIDSFKIEGRMKRAEYGAFTAFLYGKYVDLYERLKNKETFYDEIQKNQKEWEEELLSLKDLYNRGGFTKGYYQEYHGADMMSLNRPNHSGTYVGTVLKVKNQSALIRFENKVHSQDLLEIRDDQERMVYEYTNKEEQTEGSVVEARYQKGLKVKARQKVFRMKNQQLLDQIGERFLQGKVRTKRVVNFLFKAESGQPVRLIITGKEGTITVEGAVAQKAQKQPLSEEKIKKNLSKLGESLLALNEVDVICKDAVFLPTSQINELRREGLCKYEEMVLTPYHRKKKTLKCRFLQGFALSSKLSKPDVTVSVLSAGQYEAVCQAPGVRRIVMDCSYESREQILSIVNNHSGDSQLFLQLPHVLRESFFKTNHPKEPGYEASFLHQLLMTGKVSGFYVTTFDQLCFLNQVRKAQQSADFSLRGDYSLYCMNNRAKEFYIRQNVEALTAPIECNKRELSELGIEGMELFVYGHLPVMKSVQCVNLSRGMCLKQKKEKDVLMDGGTLYTILKDEKQMEFYAISFCPECYQGLYNGVVYDIRNEKDEIKSLHPASLRYYFTVESGEEILRILGNEPFPKKEIQRTFGHFHRGVQ